MTWLPWRRTGQRATQSPAVATVATTASTTNLYKRNWAYIPPDVQARLATTTLLTAGTGLGSNIAVLAARTGVQRFILADGDTVEESNLNRQAFTRAHLGKNKAEATAAIIQDIVPQAQIAVVPRYLDARACVALAHQADIILNTIDLDTPAFLELNRAARTAAKPVLFPLNPAWTGTLLVFTPDGLSLDEFIGITGENGQGGQGGQDVPISDVARLVVERIVEQLPGGVPEQMRKLVDGYFDEDSEMWHNAPQLGVTVDLTAALAVRALVALVAGEPVRVAPAVISADAFAAVAPAKAP